MYHEVMHGHHGQVQLQALPMSAVVIRHHDAALGAGIEQTRQGRIAPDDVQIRIRRQPLGNGRPALAIVLGAECVRLEIIEPMAVGGNIGDTGILGIGLDHLHGGKIGHALGGHIGPVGSAIPRQVHQPVIAAYPDQIFSLGRFSDGEDGVVSLDAGIVLGQRSARRTLLGFVVAGQIGRDHGPAAALVERAE